MSVNKYRPHVIVLPEDDANRQLAVGFEVNISTRQYYVEEEAGGWRNVAERFASDHVDPMKKNSERYMVLLLDFDNDLSRLEKVTAQIPAELRDRVFVIGSLTDPEGLKKSGLGTFEEIGGLLADDCRDDAQATWDHPLLRHNRAEIDRLRDAVRGFLFDA